MMAGIRDVLSAVRAGWENAPHAGSCQLPHGQPAVVLLMVLFVVKDNGGVAALTRGG